MAMANGNLRLRGEAYYQDDVYFTEWNRSDAAQDGYGLINANADYSFGPDGRWLVSVWGRNLSDEEIISNNIITAPLYNSLRVGIHAAAANLWRDRLLRVLTLRFGNSAALPRAASLRPGLHS
jgi:hypothetical protein